MGGVERGLGLYIDEREERDEGDEREEISKARNEFIVELMKRLFERLLAWKESYALCLRIYAATKHFPPEEKFALANQMRRAASSVPINLAEGNTKTSKKDRARFFEIALSSLNELDCECLLAKDLGYLSQEEFSDLDDRVRRTSYLINALIASLR